MSPPRAPFTSVLIYAVPGTSRGRWTWLRVSNSNPVVPQLVHAGEVWSSQAEAEASAREDLARAIYDGDAGSYLITMEAA